MNTPKVFEWDFINIWGVVKKNVPEKRPRNIRRGYWVSLPAQTSGITGLERWSGPARMQAMPKALTADDILPLVASLTPRRDLFLKLAFMVETLNP